MGLSLPESQSAFPAKSNILALFLDGQFGLSCGSSFFGVAFGTTSRLFRMLPSRWGMGVPRYEHSARSIPHKVRNGALRCDRPFFEITGLNGPAFARHEIRLVCGNRGYLSFFLTGRLSCGPSFFGVASGRRLGCSECCRHDGGWGCRGTNIPLVPYPIRSGTEHCGVTGRSPK